MSNLHFGKNGFSNFIKGKGFYVALAICLAGAGFASWAAISGTLNKLTVEDPAALESEGTWSFPATEEARENVSQLPIEQNVQSSSPEKSAVSQPSQEQAITGTEPSDSADAATQQGTQQDLSFALPLSGDILSDYSNGELVLNTTMNDWRTHNGVDIAADEGTPVKAVLAGEVSKILQSGLWGTIVEIKHANGLVSRYSSLSENVAVSEGDMVQTGEVIGTLGNSAEAEIAMPCHLHLELLRDGKFVNPFDEMKLR